VHTQGGHYRRVGACQSQSATSAFFGRAHASHGDGVLWNALRLYALYPALTLTRTHARTSIGPTSLFICILLDKKHVLPYKVLDLLIFYFIRLSHTHTPGTLPISGTTASCALPALCSASRAGAKIHAARRCAQAHACADHSLRLYLPEANNQQRRLQTPWTCRSSKQKYITWYMYAH
jgi:hypothetical protein